MKSLIKSFSSVKLAIFLLITITIASVLGTLIPQQRSPEEYVARYGQLANLLQRFQLNHLYQSWWFVALLFLFAINIITCTLTRLSPKLRRFFRPRLEKKTNRIISLKVKDRFQKPASLGKTKQQIRKALRSFHYRIKEENKENKVFLQARKKALGWFGSDVVHAGILVILAGGIISGLGAFRQNLTLSEGQTLPVPKAGFKIKLEKFETELYPNGSVKDWKSTLTVKEEEKTALTKTIEVNHPLSYKGYVFYQNSYGWNWENPALEIWVKKRSDSSYLKKIETKMGEKVSLSPENIQISVLHFIPDFVINERNQIASRSSQPNNPAAFIQGWEDNEVIFSGWIFARFPDFDQIHSEKKTDLQIELKDFKADQFSVIQVAKDPGVTFIWVGSAFLVVGLALAFYWPSREIKMILEQKNGKTDIAAGGISSKSKEAFRIEFQKIMGSLRRSK
ncbi:MAG: cytochrome c biogenesis protein ResB [Candidatus Aminicenantes bacterium]